MTRPRRVGAGDRRARLLATKLAAIVRDRTPEATPRPATFPLGAALLSSESDRPDGAWVLLDTTIDDGTGLGAATHLRRPQRRRSARSRGRRGADASPPAGPPSSGCRSTCGRSTDANCVAVTAAAPSAAAAPARPEHLRFVDDIVAAGASVVVEHGVVTGEVRGLEVCRVVDVADGETTGVRLEVGVGAHDREAFAIIHGDVPTRDALAGVVAAVADGAYQSMPPGIRSTAWRPSGCCAGGSNSSRGWSAWRRCGRRSRRCRDATSRIERRARRSASVSTARRW